MREQLRPRRKEMPLNASLQVLGVNEPFDKLLTDRQAASNALKLASERMLHVYGEIDADSRESFASNTKRIETDLFDPHDLISKDGQVITLASDVQSTAVSQMEMFIRTATAFGEQDTQIQVFPAPTKDLAR